jgi:hypothetical protein
MPSPDRHASVTPDPPSFIGPVASARAIVPPIAVGGGEIARPLPEPEHLTGLRGAAMKRWIALAFGVSILLPVAGCGEWTSSGARKDTASDAVVGAWRAKVQFKSGMLADWKGLEFMYAFNAGGTMTESSNYDAAPPGPPAYGVWRNTGPRQFEARYEVFLTKSPHPLEEIAKGGGWLPDGHGVLHEKISLAEDGKSYTSVIRWDMFDQAGKATESGVEGTGEGTRIGF